MKRMITINIVVDIWYNTFRKKEIRGIKIKNTIIISDVTIFYLDTFINNKINH